MGEYEDILSAVREDDNPNTLRFGVIHGEYTLNQLQAMLNYRLSPDDQDFQTEVIRHYFKQLDAGLELAAGSIAMEIVRNPENVEAYLQYKEQGPNFSKRQEVLDLINADQEHFSMESLEQTIAEVTAVITASRERIAELSS